MVESVDKRDERDERPSGGAEVPVRDAATTRTGEPFTEMTDKQTASSGAEGLGEGASEAAAATSAEAHAAADIPDRPDLASPAEVRLPLGDREPDAGARVIPFVPRNGVVRAAPLPQQIEPRFARSAAGPAAYGAGSDAMAASLPPAQPPPPSGFRRVAVPAGLPSDAGPYGGVSMGGATGGVWAAHVGGMFQSAAGKMRASWSWRRAFKYVALGLVALLLAYAALIAILAVAYRWVNPPASTLMLSQRLSGTEIAQVWTPIDRISPNLLQAVILSEDGQFCRHRGVDWLAMKEAIEQSLDGNARGGSTISMQTVKNLFLWPSKSYVRKAIELPLAMGTELVWPKRRMLELYLNIAEWGPGIFGAEAASRQYFGKSAAYLTAREAALLAVALPNPIERQAGAPSVGHQRLAERLQGRMRRVPNAASCALPARQSR